MKEELDKNNARMMKSVKIMKDSFKENDGNDGGEKQSQKNKVKNDDGIQYLNWKVSPIRLVPSQ